VERAGSIEKHERHQARAAVHTDVPSGDKVSAWIQITPTFLAAGMQPFQRVIRVQPLSNRGGAEKGKGMDAEIVGG
jgi:hypothetical protein